MPVVTSVKVRELSYFILGLEREKYWKLDPGPVLVNHRVETP